MDHPVVGRVKVHCYYEKVARICTFCGKIGHELTGCSDHARVSMLLQSPSQQGKYDAKQVLSPKFGVWMTNAGAIPRPTSLSTSSGSKRDHRGLGPRLGQGLGMPNKSFFWWADGKSTSKQFFEFIGVTTRWWSGEKAEAGGPRFVGTRVMSLLSWNCRGSGGSTITTLNRYLRSTRALVAFILETKCNEEVARGRIQQLPLNNFSLVPSRGRSGGLWLIWEDEVKLRVVKSTRFFILAKINLNDGKESWGLACVYGDPSRVLNHVIWEEISQFLAQMDGRACLLGDFNAISDCSDKRGGCSNLGPNNLAFRNWIQYNGLLDLGHHGPCYTWSNKQFGLSHIDQRLDKGMGTVPWDLLHPNSAIFHLPRFSSDHLPILLRTNPASVRGKLRFRVESLWSLKPRFQEVCRFVTKEGKAD